MRILYHPPREKTLLFGKSVSPSARTSGRRNGPSPWRKKRPPRSHPLEGTDGTGKTSQEHAAATKNRPLALKDNFIKVRNHSDPPEDFLNKISTNNGSTVQAGEE